jgi:hypothetical protein
VNSKPKQTSTAKNRIPRPFDASVVLPCECVGVEQLEFRHFFSPGKKYSYKHDEEEK